MGRSEGESGTTSEEKSRAKIHVSLDDEPGVELLAKSEVASQGSDSQDSESQHSESQGSDSESSISPTPQQVRDLLHRNCLFIDDKKAEEKGTSIIAHATGILDNKRASDWPKEKCLEVRHHIKNYRKENERTFVFQFTIHFLSDTRMIPKDADETELQRERDYIEVSWQKDHLRARWSHSFLANCLPDIYASNNDEDKLLA